MSERVFVLSDDIITKQSNGDNFYIIELTDDHNARWNEFNYFKGDRRYCFEMDGFYCLPERNMDTIPVSKAKKLYRITFDSV